MIVDAIDGGDGSYQPLANNFQNFIYNAAGLKDRPKTFDDLLGPKFKGKIQYSTPGQAGDGRPLSCCRSSTPSARRRPHSIT